MQMCAFDTHIYIIVIYWDNGDKLENGNSVSLLADYLLIGKSIKNKKQFRISITYHGLLSFPKSSKIKKYNFFLFLFSVESLSAYLK